jgi:hypothetical protein
VPSVRRGKNNIYYICDSVNFFADFSDFFFNEFQLFGITLLCVCISKCTFVVIFQNVAIMTMLIHCGNVIILSSFQN